MALLISPEHLEYQREEHRRSPRPDAELDFGISGHKWKGRVLAMATSLQAETILDYGAGKGRLASSLPAHRVTNYDPVTFPELPGPHDMVVCTDVLPFVEPSLQKNVLDHIASLATKGAFIVVPDHGDKYVPNRKSLAEWEAILAPYWSSATVRVLSPFRGTKRMLMWCRC